MSKGRTKVPYLTLPWELLPAELGAAFPPNSLPFPGLFFSRTTRTHWRKGVVKRKMHFRLVVLISFNLPLLINSKGFREGQLTWCNRSFSGLNLDSVIRYVARLIEVS